MLKGTKEVGYKPVSTIKVNHIISVKDRQSMDTDGKEKTNTL